MRFDYCQKTYLFSFYSCRKKPNLLSLFQTSKLRRYTIGLNLVKAKCLEILKLCRLKTFLFFFQIWFTHGFVYYGIGLNIGNIGGDLFINYFIFGLVDVPVSTNSKI